jgi:mannose-6-phosphate isomerase-like protein (cupin superfamily)
MSVDIENPKRVEKLWGYELWIHNDSEYCGKLLVFNKRGDKFSMHYHLKKKESWYIQSGGFHFYWIDTKNGILNYQVLNVGDSVLIERGLPHQLIAMNDNATVFEVSTEHFDNDSYRVYRNTPNDLMG